MAKYDRNKKLAQMRAFATAMNIEISEEEIGDVVDNNRNYVFKREVIDKDGNTVTENAKFKPSSDRVNTDIFTIEQEKIYTEQMENGMLKIQNWNLVKVMPQEWNPYTKG